MEYGNICFPVHAVFLTNPIHWSICCGVLNKKSSRSALTISITNKHAHESSGKSASVSDAFNCATPFDYEDEDQHGEGCSKHYSHEKGNTY
jgi:hypothetical protein